MSRSFSQLFSCVLLCMFRIVCAILCLAEHIFVSAECVHARSKYFEGILILCCLYCRILYSFSNEWPGIRFLGIKTTILAAVFIA